MEFYDREVTLKLQSRPLRCVYLVENREELLDAIALFTHIWGGAANAILPVPNSNEEMTSFYVTLNCINPDYVFVPKELPAQVAKSLQKLSALTIPISNHHVNQHINDTGNNLLRLSSGSLSHIGSVLSEIYKTPLEDSDVYFIDSKGTFRLELGLHLGLPSQNYQRFLSKRLKAHSFSEPESVADLLRICLTATKMTNPSILTLLRTTRSSSINFYLMQIDDAETLCLFLDDGKTLGIATAFWNCKWLSPVNKIFLPRDAFLEDIKAHALKILEFMPSIRAIHITTPLDREAALDLYNHLKKIFSDAGRDLLVKIIYGDFHFDWVPGTLSSGSTANFTRIITSEGCVRFDPTTPIGHEKNDFNFGYDVEVKFASGRRFFSPKSLTGSRLLANELWRLEYSEKNEDNLGKYWLRLNPTVRAGVKGIAGTAVPGRECSFYIHPDHVVITEHLKDVNLELKPNQHTRYAQGLVKRLGGIEDVVELINDGGSEIISALASRRDLARRSYAEDIISFLKKKRSFNEKDAKSLLNRKLQPLLASSLLRRGYSVTCPNCNLCNWFLLEEVREFVECKGCADKFQLPLHGLKFAFEPNELATQLIQEGGLAVLITAACIKSILDSSSSFIQFGGDLFPSNSKVNTNEVDLFWLTDDAFIIAECKSFFDLSEQTDAQKLQKRIEKIRESVEKNINLAKRINAQVVLLGIATNFDEIPGLFEVVLSLAEFAETQGIALHLVLNGKIHLKGSSESFEPREIKVSHLLLPEESMQNEWSVGESPDNYGGTVGANGLCDQEVLRCWITELKASS